MEINAPSIEGSVVVILGAVVVIVAGVCWGGQVLAWLAPTTAIRLGLKESADEVDPVFGADLEAEARWDALSLWPMLFAGILLLFDHVAWPYFGMVGAGSYLYFAGRGIAARLLMRSRGMRIGSQRDIEIALVALALWGATALGVIVASVIELEGR